MIVDCGGGTVDLTTRTLLKDNQLGEITESGCDFCGSIYVDEGIKGFLSKNLGISEEKMTQIYKENYGQFQKFFQNDFDFIKFGFKNDKENFKSYWLDVSEHFGFLKEFASDEMKERLQNDDIDWCLELDFDSMKEMFDDQVEPIIHLIR